MDTTAKKGDWVQIHQIVLNAGERAPHVPEDTKQVPLEMWVKGKLQHDANLNDTVEIITTTGRKVTGELTAINPGYIHSFGSFVPELHRVGLQLSNILCNDETDSIGNMDSIENIDFTEKMNSRENTND